MKKVIILLFCVSLSSTLYAQHSHAKKGKFGGWVVEVKGLANLEVIHDEQAGKLTLMVFDKDNKPMGIEKAPRINVNSFKGRKQVKLEAEKAADDGSASVFSAKNDLFKKGLKAKISIKLGGKYHTLSMPHKPH